MIKGCGFLLEAGRGRPGYYVESRIAAGGLRACTVLVCLALAVPPPALIGSARAEPVVDPAASIEFRPNIGTTGQGVPRVDIAAPGGAGISHNRYLDYDVDERGLILNNSRNGGQSRLGGSVDANPNLTTRSADIILNEVRGGSDSLLLGETEVFGPRADVIVANPNGVTCDGCGFINTGRATLTTGVPRYNARGELDFQVRDGAVRIGRDGLRGAISGLDDLDLVGRRLEVDGPLNTADTLNLIAGRLDYHYTRSRTGNTVDSITPLSGSAAGYGVDATVFGAMQAGRINVVATDAGLGVRTLGYMGTTADELFIQSAGGVELRNAESAGGIRIDADGRVEQLLSLDTYGDIQINAGAYSAGDRASLYAYGRIDIRTEQDLDKRASTRSTALDLRAGGDLSLSGDSLVVEDLNLEAGGNTTFDGAYLDAATLNSRSDGRLWADNSTVVTGGAALSAADIDWGADAVMRSLVQPLNLIAVNDIVNAGELGAADLQIDAGGLLNNTGLLLAERLNASAADLDNSGEVTAFQSADLQSGSLDNAVAGQIYAGTLTVTLDGGAGAGTNAGLMKADGLSLTADTFDNSGDVWTLSESLWQVGGLTNSGLIGSNNALALTGDTYNSATDARLEAQTMSLTLSGALDNRGRLDAGTFETFEVGGALTNDGLLVSDNDYSVTAGSIFNTGRLLGREALALNATGTLENSGTIESLQSMTLEAGRVDNDDTVFAGTDLTVSAGDIDNRGMIESGGNATIDATGTVDNAGALIAGTHLELDAARLTNTGSADGDGILAGTARFDLTGTLDNESQVRVRGLLDMTADAFRNRTGGLFDTGSLAYSGDTFVNEALVKAVASAEIDSATLDNRAGARIDAYTLTLDGDRVFNRGALSSGDVLAVNTRSAAAQAFENSGIIVAGGEWRVGAEGLSGNRGLVNEGRVYALADARIHGRLLNEAEAVIDITGNLALHGDLVTRSSYSPNGTGYISGLDRTRGHAGYDSNGTPYIDYTFGHDVLEGATYDQTPSILSVGGDLSHDGGDLRHEAVLVVGGDMTTQAGVFRNTVRQGDYTLYEGSVSGGGTGFTSTDLQDVLDIYQEMTDEPYFSSHYSSDSQTLSATNFGDLYHPLVYSIGYSATGQTSTQSVGKSSILVGGALTGDVQSFNNQGSIQAASMDFTVGGVPGGGGGMGDVTLEEPEPFDPNDLPGNQDATIDGGDTGGDVFNGLPNRDPRTLPEPDTRIELVRRDDLLDAFNLSAEEIELLGETFNVDRDLSAEAVFGELGALPNAEFFADPVTEALLLREAALRSRGQALFTDEYRTEREQRQALYDNTVDYLKTSDDIRLGRPLSDAQIADLEQPLLWYETQAVDGKDYLVPVVYFPAVRAPSLPANGQLVADTIGFQTEGEFVNRGVIEGRDSLSLTAGRLENRGRMVGGELSLESRGELVNRGRLSADRRMSLFAEEDIDNWGLVDGPGDIHFEAGRDINTGGRIRTLGDITLFAGRDLTNRGTIETRATAANSQRRYIQPAGGQTGKGNAGSIFMRADTGTLTNSGRLDSAADLTLYGRDLRNTEDLRSARDMTLTAEHDLDLEALSLDAGNDLTLSARDINLTARRIETESGTENNLTRTVRHEVSELQAGGDIAMRADRDLTSQAARLQAGDDIALAAGGDMNFEAVYNEDYHYEKHVKKKSFGRKKTTIQEDLVITAQGGSLEAGGDVLINMQRNEEGGLSRLASNDVTFEATDIDSDGDVMLAADGDINVLAAETVEYHRRETHKRGAFGLESESKGRITERQGLEAATLKATDDLGVLSKSDITVVGADMQSGGDTRLQAGGNVQIRAGETRETTREWHEKRALFDGGDLMGLSALESMLKPERPTESFDREETVTDFDAVNTRTVRHEVSDINAGGNLSVQAGNDMTAEAAELGAGGDIAVAAGGDMRFEAVQDEDYLYEEHSKNRSRGRRSKTILEDQQIAARGTGLSAGGNIRINVDAQGGALDSGSVTFEGSRLDAGEQVLLAADDDINIYAANESSYHREEKHKSDKFGLDKNSSGQISERHTLAASTLTASDDLDVLSTDGNINIVASELESGGDTRLEAWEDVVIGAGEVVERDEQWSNQTRMLDGSDLYTNDESREGRAAALAQGSRIQSGGDIAVTAGSATVIGSSLQAAGGIKATTDVGDIEVLAARETEETYSNEKRVRVSVADGAEGLTRPDQMVENDEGQAKVKLADAQYDSVDEKTTAVTHKGSELAAGEDIELDSVGDIMVEGSTLTADIDGDHSGDLSLTADGDITVKEAEDFLNRLTEETHGKAELNFVVQHQAVEVVKAVKGVHDARDQLKQAKQDYRAYEKDLNRLEGELESLEQAYTDGESGITYDDVMELREIVEETRDDEDWYQAGIAAAAANVTAKTTLLVQQVATAAQSATTWGFNAGIQLDVEATKTKTEENRTTSLASNLSGQNIAIRTGGETGPDGTQTLIQGSHLNANDMIAVDTGELNIQASKDTYSSNTESESGHISIQQTLWGATSGPAVNADFSRSRSKNKQSTWNNSTLNASQISLTSSADTAIRGANVHADEQLTLDVGENLFVESKQNRSRSSGNSVGISGGFGFGESGNMTSVNAGMRGSNSRARSKETVLTSLTSGGSAEINVGEHTQVTGALIATVDEDGNDLGNLSLSTGTFDYADLENTHYSSEKSAGISTSIGLGGAEAGDPAKQKATDASGDKDLQLNTSNIQYSNASHYDKGKTLATLGQGVVEIRDEEGSGDISRLNRDTGGTEKELFEVDRQKGNIDLTVDHRMMSEEGRRAIGRDFEKVKENVTQVAEKVADAWNYMTNAEVGPEKIAQLEQFTQRQRNNVALMLQTGQSVEDSEDIRYYRDEDGGMIAVDWNQFLASEEARGAVLAAKKATGSDSLRDSPNYQQFVADFEYYSDRVLESEQITDAVSYFTGPNLIVRIGAEAIGGAAKVLDSIATRKPPPADNPKLVEGERGSELERWADSIGSARTRDEYLESGYPADEVYDIRNTSNSGGAQFDEVAREGQRRQQQLLESGKGYNVTGADSEIRYPDSTVGNPRPANPDGLPGVPENGTTFLTDRQGIEDVVGSLPREENVLRVTKDQLRGLENGLGLDPKSLESGSVIREFDNVDQLNPASPLEGNDFFRGPGQHLPSGAPEVVINPAQPKVDNPNITKEWKVELKSDD